MACVCVCVCVCVREREREGHITVECITLSITLKIFIITIITGLLYKFENHILVHFFGLAAFQMSLLFGTTSSSNGVPHK